MSKTWLQSVILAGAVAVWGCGSNNNGGGAGGSPQSGGAGGGNGGAGGKSSASGGATSNGGSSSGGASGSGGSASGGTTTKSDGGSGSGGSNAGGSNNAGGATGGGGAAAGGSTGTGTGKDGGGAGAPGGAGGGAPIDASAAGGSGGGGGSGPGDVTVHLDKVRQTIQGFGLNTALVSNSVPISTIYGTTGADGIGLSILRVGMNSSGQLTGSGISEAKAKNAKIIGSVWSAPADWKSNKSETRGGYLLENYYEQWAERIANFAKTQGLYAMSVANESDFASCEGVPVCTNDYETMTYTAKQMVAWIKVVGKKFKEIAPNTKVIAPEASEWIHAWSNLSGTGSIVSSHPNSSDPHKCGCFSNTIDPEKEKTCDPKCLNGDGYDYGHWLWKDQEAWKAFDIFGVHEYDSQIAYAWPADVNDGKRDKEVWQTEMSGVMHWPEQGPSIDINNGVAVAGWIHSALTVGEASAWLYWWYEAYFSNDNEGLAIIQGNSTKAKRFYTMGNYSKFVRPGYVAVQTADASKDVLISAYKSEDGKTVVIVAINKGTGAASPKIGFAGGTAPTSCTPTVTSANDNLKDGTAVAVADGVLTASLASKTVTTYVCK